MDNTMYLIGKIKSLSDQFIINELAQKGIVGIVPSHGEIILSLLMHETLSMTELSEKIGKDPSTVTTLVKKLNHLGYVSIFKDEKDKRISRVALTHQGKDFENIFKDISEKIFKIQYLNMSESDIALLRRLLSSVLNNFTEK